ncbi:NEL-type E3 ubiquitin ligase domain-containing protein [Pseudomonas fontis]|uniref:RING-type E3 ubiquitin transferase n=1 Tax=Pseudomonas fontis TaxID=2942633 RepID=A0ABT5NUB5_9PSED|nr:NEL-type E3 ubiquitin ligase domain-containing protein [Pseudomonas fontis]MDD0973922.1 hypothetical protein [Pseudomonas fontis]MDD0991764.1 hypothetical protein [Pseudomonas fontis]
MSHSIAPVNSTLLAPTAPAVDHFIAAQAPPWLTGATAQQLAILRSSLEMHQALQADVRRLMQAIRPLDVFARSLLDEVLNVEAQLSIDVDKAHWREVKLRVVNKPFPVVPPELPDFQYYKEESSLLTRALQNFTEQQAGPSAHFYGSGLVLFDMHLSMLPETFAGLCRRLDLGGRYQRHLQEVFEQAGASPAQSPVQLLKADMRCHFEVQAHLSHMKEEIDFAAYGMLMQLAHGNAEVTYARYTVRTVQLQALGCRVHDVLVFEVLSELMISTTRGLTLQPVRQLVVYLPGAPERPFRQYASWATLASELEQALKSADFYRYFMRLLGPDEQARFTTAFALMLSEQRHELELLALPFRGQTFMQLAHQRIERIKVDAAILAVPTASVDTAVYRQRVRAYESAGLTLLGVVASFVPVLRELMLASMVGHMLVQVYEGVGDWAHGRRQAALDHLLGVAEDVAATAAIAAGGAAAVSMFKRSAFVDGLQPVLLEDGSARLWHGDLAPYQTLEPLPAGQLVSDDGLVHISGKQLLIYGASHYQVERHHGTGHWRIRHPRRPQAFAPRLEFNDDSAWQLPTDQALQWQGLANLLQRSSVMSQGLSALDCEQVASIVDIDEAQMRGLLVENRCLPPGLYDALEHVNLDIRVSRFVEQLGEGAAVAELDPQLYRHALDLLGSGPDGLSDEAGVVRQRTWPGARLGNALFERALAQRQPSVDEQAAILLRDFPGLPIRYAQALIDQAGDAQGQAMLHQGRVPLAMAEAARDALREARLIRALLGLKLRNCYYVDSVRLVFGLLRWMRNWPVGLSLELRDGSVVGRVLDRQLAQAQTSDVRILLRREGRFDVYSADGVELSEAPADPAGLCEAILACLSVAQRDALGWGGQQGPAHLHDALLGWSLADRKHAATLIGLAPAKPRLKRWLRMPDGRLGYPLSGGVGQLPSFSARVRALFPGFDEAQVDAFLAQLQGTGHNVMAGLLRYEYAFRRLETVLTDWTHAVTGSTGNWRNRVAGELRRCWRRQTDRVYANDGSVLGYRLRLNSPLIYEFPQLPTQIDFSHVVDLNLSGTGLTFGVESFLQAFTGVHWLDLSDCQLYDIPQAISHMPALTGLYLENNAIRISSTGTSRLAELARLSELNLEGNPLRLSLDLGGLTRLHIVNLRNTQLSSFPTALLNNPSLAIADLRDNQIGELPEAYFQAPAQVRSAITLHDNPLSAPTQARLLALTEPDAAALEFDGHVGAEEGRRRWLAESTAEQLVSRNTLWQGVQGEARSADFFRLLADVTETAEYRQARDLLATRTWKMLQAMHDNTSLREDLFSLASSPATCGDSVMSTFNMLEVRFQLFLAQMRGAAGNQRQALLYFARQLFRLDGVEHLASVEIASRREAGRAVDEVEVSLAYRTGLARELDLPGQSTHMLFANLAEVSAQDLSAAADTVREAEASDHLAHYISSRDFWLEYLHEEHSAAFEAREAPFWARLDQLTEQADSMPEGEYLQQMQQVREGREDAVHSVAYAYTVEALRAQAEG